MKYFYILVFTLINVSLGCPLDDCSQVKCVQGFNPFDCPSGTIYFNKAALCGCCPGCLQLRGPGEACQGESKITFDVKNYYISQATYIPTEDIPVVGSTDCAPGLKCIDNKCSDYTYICGKDPYNEVWSPACDIDGSYQPVQCKKGSDPRCFCYNKEGKRIFGSDWQENSKEMKCQCSRLIDELKKNPDNIEITFHCSQNGNFEPLQCNRGMCYCANVYTGQPYSAVIPEEWWTTLPCYNSTRMGSTYLKICDSQYNALALIKKEMQYHGGDPITLEAPQCDPDGSFFSKQCDGSQCFCKTRANVEIGGYFTERNTPSETTQTCYCARDKVIYQDAGRSHSFRCDGGGNYVTFQVFADTAVCVDGDGAIAASRKMEDVCELYCASEVQCPPPG